MNVAIGSPFKDESESVVGRLKAVTAIKNTSPSALDTAALGRVLQLEDVRSELTVIKRRAPRWGVLAAEKSDQRPQMMALTAKLVAVMIAS